MSEQKVLISTPETLRLRSGFTFSMFFYFVYELGKLEVKEKFADDEKSDDKTLARTKLNKKKKHESNEPTTKDNAVKILLYSSCNELKQPLNPKHKTHGYSRIASGHTRIDEAVRFFFENSKTEEILKYIWNIEFHNEERITKSLQTVFKDCPNLIDNVGRICSKDKASLVQITEEEIDPEDCEDYIADALRLAVINSDKANDCLSGAEKKYFTDVYNCIAEGKVPVFQSSAQSITMPGGVAFAAQTETEPVKESVLASHSVSGFEVFTGRDAQINKIHEAFATKNVVFLHSMGGIGKSALAYHYWEHNADFYSTFVFAKYEKNLAALIANDLVFRVKGLSRKIEKDDTLQTDEEYAIDKLEQIKRNTDERTLIVLDNYDVDTDPLFETFVRNARFHLLVTTRNEPECGEYHVLPVGTLSDEALKDMFLQYASSAMLDRDDPDFPVLFELTERHTLTLELIAKYMADVGVTSVGEMVALLNEKHLPVLSETDEKDRYGRIRDLLRMTQLNEKETMFLRCLALTPGVHQELFKKWCKECFSAKARLSRRGLIKLDSVSKTVSLHPVIREIILSELAPDYNNCRTFINRCAMVGDAYIQKMWALTYNEKRQHYDCYESVLKHVPEITVDTFQLFVNISTMANYFAPLEDAMSLHERIYRFACEHFGKASEEAMLVLNKMGWKYSNIGEVKKAIPYYREAADWFLAHPNYYSKEALSCIQGCADSYYWHAFQYTDDKNSYDEAYLNKGHYYWLASESYEKEMLALVQSEEEPGFWEEHVECKSRVFLKLALRSGLYNTAESILLEYREAIEAFDKKTGKLSEIERGDWSYYWGKLQYESDGDCLFAIHCLEDSRDIYRKYYGTNYARMIDILETLYLCNRKAGFAKEAERYLREALDAANSLYKNGHPVFERLKSYQKTVQN